MDKCPSTGNPCPHPKINHTTTMGLDGSIVEAHYCQGCGKITPPAIPHGGIVDALLNAIFGAPKHGPKMGTTLPTIEEPQCPACGYTFSMIATTGRIGCPECYNQFDKQLAGTLEECQRSLRHEGKCPKKRPEDIQSLQEKMKKAIEVENYEVAGVIKKKIDELRQQGVSEI